MIFHFDGKYFHVKINIYRDTAKIQVFNRIFQLKRGEMVDFSMFIGVLSHTRVR